MNISRLMLLIIGTHIFIGCNASHEPSPQELYITKATQEWDQTYVQTLDPYQLQLLTSYLHLLSNQALYTSNIEEKKQHILWKPYEIVHNNNKDIPNTIISLCNDYYEYIPSLKNTNDALEICTQCINKLDSTYAQPLNEALDAVAEIGREALTFHDQELVTHSQTIIQSTYQTLQELFQQSNSLKEIVSMPETIEDYKQLAQFYALQKFTTDAAEKAWNIIALNVVQTIKHVELMNTCSLVFESCFALAQQRLMSNEIPVQYRTLLFS